MLSKFLKFIKKVITSKIFTAFLVLGLSVLVLNKFSSVSKIESKYELRKADSIVEDFGQLAPKLKNIHIMRYPSVDLYFIELGKSGTLIEKEVSRLASNRIISEHFGPKKVPYDITESNAIDDFIFYFIAPIKSLIGPLVDRAVVIIPLIFFIIMIVVFYRQSKAKGKFDVLYPSDISGSLDNLIGMDDLKKQVRPLIKRHEYTSRHKAYNVNKTFNIIFSGPPGTGKTKFAGYLAKELNLPLIVGSASSLETGLVGGGSNVLETLHKEAKKLKKCVVFLDEAQVLFARRGANTPLESKHRDDTPNTLLAILDGVKTSEDIEIIWIFASNFNESNYDVDPAMMRRFKLKLDFRLPNKEERIAIFQMYLNKIDAQYLGEIDYGYIGEISAGLSPADIETVVDLAAIACSEEHKPVSTHDIYLAYERNMIGNTNRETTAFAQEKRKLVGIHEMGHFVVEFDNLVRRHNGDFNAIKDSISVLKISTESVAKLGALGYVLSKQEEIGLKTLEDLEDSVKKLYGGVAAEKVFYGARAITTGSSDDIQKISQILRMMIFELGMYSDSKINYSVVNSDAKNVELIAAIESKSSELFEETEKIINRHKKLIEFITPVLLEKYVLQIDEMMKLIEDFYRKEGLLVEV